MTIMNRAIFLLGFLSLTACSSMDSTQPFDQHQAALLLSESHTLHPTQQMIKLSLPDKQRWKKIDLSYGTVGTPAMLVPRNESATTWTESIRTTIAAYSREPYATPQTALAQQIKTAKALCKQVNATTLNDQRTQLTYRLTQSQCASGKDQDQIGHIFEGREAVYVVYYTALQQAVTANERNRMTRVIETAQLVRDPRLAMNGAR